MAFELDGESAHVPQWGDSPASDDRLVDRFNALLAVLQLPVRLSTLARTTPSLLLSVLEAILETRIIDVPSSWRSGADLDPETSADLARKLLRAINQVVAAITARLRTGPPPQSRVDQLDPVDAATGEPGSQRALLHVLLWVADALDVKSRPPSRRRRKLGALGPDSDDSRTRVTLQSSRRFSPRPRAPVTSPKKPQSPPRFRTALPRSDSPSRWRGEAQDRHRETSTATTSEPAPVSWARPESPPRPSPSVLPPPTTPTRSHLPASTSFLAELARTRSPGHASQTSSRTSTEGTAGPVRAGVPFGSSSPPPVSPRKSIVQVMRSLEARRRLEREGELGHTRDGRQSPTTRRPRRDPPLATVTRPTKSTLASPKATQAPHYRGFSPSPVSSSSTTTFSRPRSSPSPSSSSDLPSDGSGPDDTGPCTCSGLAAIPGRSPSARSPSFRHSRASARPHHAPSSASAPTPRPTRGRIRLSRLSTIPVVTTEPSPCHLSVHSSTDFDSSEPPGTTRRISAVKTLRSTPPPGVTRLVPPDHQIPTVTATIETPSPYTLLLLAHRDRLREKLRILERRERDRKAAAAAGAVEPEPRIHAGRHERPVPAGMAAA